MSDIGIFIHVYYVFARILVITICFRGQIDRPFEDSVKLECFKQFVLVQCIINQATTAEILYNFYNIPDKHIQLAVVYTFSLAICIIFYVLT